jgi:hypothetical protein
MKRTMLMAIAAGTVLAVSLSAQTNAPANPNEGMHEGMMMCPMSGMSMGGPGMGPGAMNPQARESMQMNMTAAVTMSQQEIASALQVKKAELGLKDAQIKKLAAAIETAQQAKLKQHFDKTGSMESGQCGFCPGMQTAPK